MRLVSEPTERVDLVGNVLDSYSGGTKIRISAEAPAITTEYCCDFPQSLQANIIVVPRPSKSFAPNHLSLILSFHAPCSSC
jgi:hypothetical protein